MPNTNQINIQSNDTGDSAKAFRKRIVKKRFNTQKKLAKKRTSAPYEWKDNVAKKKRLAGIEGVGRKKSFRARTIGGICSSSKCNCSKDITTAARQSAFKSYWNLDSYERKWQCISNWVKYKTVPNDLDEEYAVEEVKKRVNLTYTFPNEDGTYVKVCSKMFLTTLGKFL